MTRLESLSHHQNVLFSATIAAGERGCYVSCGDAMLMPPSTMIIWPVT